MKPIAFVHAGQPKTGSTSIQHFLGEQEALVTGQGLHIPRTGCSHGVHHILNHSLTGRDGNSKAIAAELTAELEAAGKPDLVISAESIDGVVVGAMRRSEEGEGAGAPAIELLRVLHAAGYHVRFILYVRNVPQMLNSLYQQDTKAMRNDTPFAEWCEARLPRRSRSLARWSRVAELDDVELLPRPFNTAVKRDGVVRDFCRTLGIEPPAAEPPRVNESIGPIHLEALRQLHRRNEKRLGGAQEALALRRSLRLICKRQKLAEPRYCGLTTERARAYEAAAAAETEAFAQRHWGHAWAEAFADDMRESFVLNDIAELGDAAALETAHQLMRAAIRHNRKRAAA